LALIIGEAEAQADQVSIKPLRDKVTDQNNGMDSQPQLQSQFTASQNDAVEAVTNFLKSL